MRRFLILSPALALALAACGGSGSGAPGGHAGPPGGGMPPTAVDTAKVESRSLPAVFETVGSLRADESAEIRPEVAGKIEQIHFRDGQRVSAGTLLFSLDAALTEADLNEALANLENSKRANARATELSGKQLISRADLDSAKAAFAVDQARVASARTRLEKMRIRAPFDGVVGLREVSVGDYVNAGQAMVNLVRMDPMDVDFRVPEVELEHLAPGQKVKVEVDAYPGETFEGEIAAISPSIEAAGRSASVRARVANPDSKLRPGLFARVQIVLGTNPQALMVPEQAIWPNGDQKMVFQVVAGTAKLVPVTLGERIPGFVEVTSGLKVGDEVVTAGQLKLFDGAKVAPTAPAPAAPASAAPAGAN